MIKRPKVLRNVDAPAAIIGKTGAGQSEFRMPVAIAINKDGRLFYVADTLNRRIQCFTGNGEYLMEFAICGPNGNYSPAGIAINENTKELIVPRVLMNERESMGDTVQIYSFDGQLKHEVKNMRLGELTNVLVLPDDNFVVSDWFEHSLFVFEKGGKLVRRIGDRGYNTTHFRRPSFLGNGFDSDIIVSDPDRCRIQVVDKMGTIKNNFGANASGHSIFTVPSGVCVDTHGNILVCDEVQNCVHIFTYFGEFRGTIESANDPLNFPQGIACTPDGYCIVVDTKNDCLKIFKYLEFAG